jgi:hypothetical protein
MIPRMVIVVGYKGVEHYPAKQFRTINVRSR